MENDKFKDWSDQDILMTLKTVINHYVQNNPHLHICKLNAYQFYIIHACFCTFLCVCSEARHKKAITDMNILKIILINRQMILHLIADTIAHRKNHALVHLVQSRLNTVTYAS